MRTNRRNHHQKGAAHVVALWMLVLLTVIVVGFAHSVSNSLYFKRLLDTRLDSRHVAGAGIDLALGLISTDFEYTVKHCGSILAFSQNTQPGERLPLIDSIGRQLDSLSWISLMDEQGKLNLNVASEAELMRIPGVNNELAASIIDWRDADNNMRTGGAESRYYMNLAIPHECKNLPFESVEELLLVKGANPVLFERINMFLTVYGDGSININATSPQVLVAMGLEESLAGRLVKFRFGPDGITGTDDDFVFSEPDSIEVQIARNIMLDADEKNQIRSLVVADRFCTHPRFLRVKSSGLSERLSVRSTITTVIEVTKSGRIHTLFWSES